MKFPPYSAILALFAVLGLALPAVASENPAAETKPAAKKEQTEKKSDAKDAAKPADEEEKPSKKASSEIEKMEEDLKRLGLERDLLQAQNSIAEAKLAQELAERKAKLEREKLALEEAAHELQKKTSSLNKGSVDEVARLKSELERAQLESQISKARMDQRINELRTAEEELKQTVVKLRYEIDQKEKQLERETYADQDPVYLEQPLQGNALIISDRRIEMNGVITSKTAEHVSDRINYFNNKSVDFPIFIVIDDSPGGSVMAGYKILKAMASSEAPVHVVVKSYAASMAAVITALADKSYAYPNAILLQHQLSGVFAGNLTQQREDLEETEEWWRRLAEPVAKKMGISLEDFVKRMYEQESTGDWDEFADEAQKLKWVDVIVQEIRETSLIRNPDARSAPAGSPHPLAGSEEALEADEFGLRYATDEKGHPICILPRINHHDRWWLYNPEGYYRLP